MFRLSTLQALSFGSMGAVLPFMALELRDSGVDPVSVMVAMLCVPLASLVLGPAWGWVTDRRGQVRGALLIATGLGVLGTLGLVSLPIAGVVVAAVVFALARSGMSPLVEAASLSAVGHDPGRYGGLRRWGSVGFLLSVLTAGVMRDHLGLSPFWLGLGLAVGTVALVMSLAPQPAQTSTHERPPVSTLFKDSVVWMVLLASALHFAGIAVYDGFFAVHIDSLGHGSTWVGLAAVLGIGVEVGVLSIAALMVRRVGAPALFIGAMALNMPRWALMIVWTDPMWVVPLQAVHGLTFGAFWVAAIALLSERAPRSLSGSVQGLLAAAAGGVGSLIGNAAGSVLVATGQTWRLFAAALGLATAATLVAVIAVVLAKKARPGVSQGGPSIRLNAD